MCDIGGDGVGKNEKLIECVKGLPKDLTFDEVVRLLSGFGYIQKDKGKTSGSRVIFVHEKRPPILLHKPHPRKELLVYQVRQLGDFLQGGGLI